MSGFLPKVQVRRLGQAPSDPAAAAAAAAAAQAAQSHSQQAALLQNPDGTIPSNLEIHGALVKMKVMPPAGSTGTPQEITAMIDTGASISGVQPDIAQAAGLVQVSSVQIGGVVGAQERPIYAAKVSLPEYNIEFDAIDMAGVDLPQQDIQALIGRDMLKKMQLKYDGVNAEFSLESPQSDLLSTIVSGGVALAALGSLFALARVNY